MTDLERHWDDLPVGPAPVDAILREARRESRPQGRRPEARLKRSLVTITALGGIAAAFVAGSLVTQDAADPPSPTGPGQAKEPGGGDTGSITPAAFQGELQAPESCDELLQHYVDRGLDRVGPYGWNGPYGYLTRDGVPLASENSSRATLPDVDAPQAYTTAPKGAADSATGTNVQEAGVDEPDTVKTDGSLVVRLRDAELTTYDASGDEITELGNLDLGDFHDGEILLAGDTVVAVGNDGTRPRADDYGVYLGKQQTSPQTRVLTIDIADPAAPELRRTVDYDAELVATRQHGTDVRVVVKKGLPDLDFEQDERALRANRALVEATTIDDWLPHVSVDGGKERPLLECDRVAIPRAELGLATMAVVGFGATSPGDVEALGLAGDAPLSYESADHLYLASSGTGNDVCFDFCDFGRTTGSGFDGTTHVYDFALDGTGASYVGAGEVEGTVRDRWSMDEVDGVLRLAVGPSSETGNFNSIVTMRAQTGDQGDELVEIGRLDGLGVGEQIKAVRWFGGLALLVTFREVDPLYAVDLTDQEDPTLIGELKIPGFSSYLHPLGPDRVIGIGTGPQPGGRSGAQAGLFLVRDLTDPRRVDVESYGRGTYAKAGDDPRQFTWLPEQRIALTVIQRGRTVSVSTLRLDGGQMANEVTQVEFGSDADDVRLVPLLDGKVALVTGEGVEMFPLT